MKRILALGLLLGLVMCLAPDQAVAASSLEDEVLPALAVMGVLNGDEKGDLKLDSQVTRAEFVKMAVSASSMKAQGQTPSAVSPYPDVRAGAWHSGYITAAMNAGLITGYLDGTFKPDNVVTLEEGVSVMLKAMGYTDADFTSGYPAAHLTLYHSLGMDSGMTAQQGQRLTRRDCARLIYNCLGAKTKSGVVYANQLGYSLDAQGNINYAALTLSLTQGPILFEGELEKAVGFKPLTVYRDRSLSSADKLMNDDVLYYIKDVRTVWAYSKKVSGVVQNVSPSTANPATVTVSGVNCALGSSSAIYAFSDLGTVKIGDSVTLLLGAGGQCVYVRSGGQIKAQTIYGVVASVGAQVSTDGYGSAVQSGGISIMATDGRTYSYPYSGSLKAGAVVKVTVGEKVNIVSAGSSVTPSGFVKKGKLGGYKLDGSVEILDFSSTRAVTVTADRLEGVNIPSSKVAFCLIEDNAITKLILKDVTGDMHDYGVVSKSVQSPDIMTTPSTFVYIVNGVPSALTAKISGAGEGPCRITYQNGSVKSLSALKGKRVENLTGNYAQLADVGEMGLGGNMQVYLRENDQYYLTSRMDVSLDTHRLAAYYDNTVEGGGCVRIIIAEKK